jgi:hypothetical protein
MPEFGDIFDYQKSALCFECATVMFMAIYVVAGTWLLTSSGGRTFGRLLFLTGAEQRA